ncbi:MAG: methionyl-tRNA formyltransferase, partial [Mangrovimonas sp.]|nr:methionyl-tRNA formyltransferase [Mangrovimonas sp.]
YNQIRGLSPYPAAWCTLVNDEDRMDIKIYASEKDPCQHHTTYGSLMQDKNTLKVAVKGGFLWLEEIQLPGKRKMDVKSLLNGFQLKTGAKLV